jgi:MFS family permease
VPTLEAANARGGDVQAVGTSRPVSRRAWIVWAVAALCYLAALFHRASLGIAAPEALDRFSAGPALLSLFSALQLGVYLVLQIPSGLLADRLGPRRVIAVGVLAMALGSLVFGLSASLVGGITGRMLIGLGDAFMFINVLRLVAVWFPVGRFGKIAALTGLAGGVGQVVSTVPLSLSLHGFGWEPTFVGAAVVTGALAVGAVLVIRDRPAHVEVERRPAERIGVALRGVIAQRGTKHSFWLHFALMAQFIAVTALWGSPWLTKSQGWSKSDAGSLLMACVAAFIVGSWFAGSFIAGRVYRRERYALWLSWVVVAAWVVVVLWPGVLPFPVLAAVLVVVGVGGGGSMLAFDGARSSNLESRSGTATGVVNMGGFTAAVLIQLLVGVMLQLSAHVPPLQAYRWAFIPVIVLVAGATVAQVWTCAPRSGVRDPVPAG